MAPEKATQTVLEACTQATLLCNPISVRMLEYVSTARRPPKSLRVLAYDFLDTCRVLWSIEAGLSDPAARRGRPFPSELTAEMCRKIGLARTAFARLDALLARFLECERAAGLSRFFMRLRVGLFGDADISRVRDALCKSNEALRMSAVVLHWSLGDNPPRIPGVGFNGLREVLERMGGNGRPAAAAQAPASPMKDRDRQRERGASEEGPRFEHPQEPDDGHADRGRRHEHGEDDQDDDVSDARSFTTLPESTPRLPPQLPPMPEFTGRIMSMEYLPSSSNNHGDNHLSLPPLPAPPASLPNSPATTRPPSTHTRPPSTNSKKPSWTPLGAHPPTPTWERQPEYHRWLQGEQPDRTSQAVVPDAARLSKLLAAKNVTRAKGSTSSSRGDGGDMTLALSECATENDTLVDIDDLHHHDALLAKRAEQYVRSRRSMAYSIHEV